MEGLKLQTSIKWSRPKATAYVPGFLLVMDLVKSIFIQFEASSNYVQFNSKGRGWLLGAIRKPVEGIIQAEKFRVSCQKPQCLRPKRRQRIRIVVDIDCKPVNFIIAGHVAEDVVANVAEESNLHPLA